MARVPAKKNATQVREAIPSIGAVTLRTGVHRRSLRLRRVSPVDERGRKGITFERRIKRFWAGRGPGGRDSHKERLIIGRDCEHCL